jgi:hypothetical protein
MSESNDNHIHAEPVEVTGYAPPLHADPVQVTAYATTRPAQGQSARDKFIDALHSRRMMQPGKEWVIDANLAAYAKELADKLRAHGHDEAANLIDPTKSTQP